MKAKENLVLDSLYQAQLLLDAIGSDNLGGDEADRFVRLASKHLDDALSNM